MKLKCYLDCETAREAKAVACRAFDMGLDPVETEKLGTTYRVHFRTETWKEYDLVSAYLLGFRAASC